MYNNNNLKDLDTITLLGTFLGVLNYIDNSKELSNNEIMEEVKRQTDYYLSKIIEQNEEILRLLKEGK